MERELEKKVKDQLEKKAEKMAGGLESALTRHRDVGRAMQSVAMRMLKEAEPSNAQQGAMIAALAKAGTEIETKAEMLGETMKRDLDKMEFAKEMVSILEKYVTDTDVLEHILEDFKAVAER